MFNKYRGQTQIKNQNSPSDHHERTREPQPEPAVMEKVKPEPVKKPSAPFSMKEKPTPTVRVRSEADNELLRQQEEDEWFRKFKGESEPVAKEEPVLEKPFLEDALEVEEELESINRNWEEPLTEDQIEEPMNLEEPEENVPEFIPEEPEPMDLEGPEDNTPEFMPEEPEPMDLEGPEENAPEFMPEESMDLETPEEPESIDSEKTAELPEEDFAEELSALEAELEENEKENEVISSSSILEEAIPVTMFEELEREDESEEEEPALTPEEDDEKWIQDLLTDIQEKTGTVPEEKVEPLPISAAGTTEYEAENEGDEAGWYQSTPLIRTAALIVLDLTEDQEEEPYIEETEEDYDSYQSDADVGQEELPEEPDAVLNSIDEVSEEMPEKEIEEVTIDDIDEKLASLMKEEPKEDLDMDAVLDNMDRFIQQTEATPVRFVEEPVPQPRLNPNRNRKKKKKKKR